VRFPTQAWTALRLPDLTTQLDALLCGSVGTVSKFTSGYQWYSE